MNVYKISYQAALDGEYRERVRHTNWESYFDRMGARVLRHYGDPELELSSDHLQNVVNLIYSGRKQGIDEIVLSLDQEDAKTQLWEHSYAVAFLPEVITEFELEDDQPVLRVKFSKGLNTPGYAPLHPARTRSDGRQPKSAPGEQLERDEALSRETRDLSEVMIDEIHTLTSDDIKTLLDEVVAELKAEAADRQNKGLPNGPHKALRDAIRSDSYHKVTLPAWVIIKYELSGDDAKPGKKLADCLLDTRKIWEK